MHADSFYKESDETDEKSSEAWSCDPKLILTLVSFVSLWLAQLLPFLKPLLSSYFAGWPTHLI